MRKCCTCKEEKPLDHFYWKIKKKGIKQTVCMTCDRAYKEIWYQKNKEKHKANTKRNRHKNARKARKFLLNYYQTHPCTNCGFNDPRCLEFHHIKGKKKYLVGGMVTQGHGLTSIKKEIRKCQVLCANCHRIKTSKVQNWYKS
jgi:hypothetical protein